MKAMSRSVRAFLTWLLSFKQKYNLSSLVLAAGGGIGVGLMRRTTEKYTF